MSFRWIGLVALLAFVLATSATACKQGVGERCQVNADCEDGLVCNASEAICQEMGGGVVDARTTDAPIPIDAPPVDAGADAMTPDAMQDAMVNDAMVNDAAAP